MKHEDLKDWAENRSLLRIGSTGSAVRILQSLIEEVDGDLYNGVVDGVFGKLTHSAVMRYQEARLLSEDGIAGPITKHDFLNAHDADYHLGKPFKHPEHSIEVYGSFHPRLGDLPDLALGRAEEGKVSWFGGPNDPGDRIYGQAYVRGDKSPKAVFAKHPELAAMGILRTDIATLDEYPTVTGPGGVEAPAGTSWCLNPESFFCAMRWKVGGISLGYYNAKNPRLLVTNERTGAAVVCLRTDYGPNTSTKRLIDLSHGAITTLGLKTDDIARVCWATDDAEIGPLTV